MRKPILTELIVKNVTVRERELRDMSQWFAGINSVLRPSSLKCIASRNGKWENCIVTGKLADDASGRLRLTIIFPDATVITAYGRKSSFLPEPYTKALEEMRKGSVKRMDDLLS